ncbi:MAG: aminotransferase class V-fold PLP-dependent enzyme [Nitratireductor sp.]
MIQNNPDLLAAIRSRFAHIDSCPFAGERIFFENAGGALTLKSVAETSAKFAAIPDNQGRSNAASKALVEIIDKARSDLTIFMNAKSGQFIIGESGTELLFRTIRTICMNAPKGAKVIGSTIEHPSSRSAAIHWAKKAGLEYVNVDHDNELGHVSAEAYAAKMTPDVKVATILHASPVTGIGMDVTAIVKAIRAVSPDCFIVVDGIQHSAHGDLDLDAYNIDAYVISPYKVFSRHGYGVAWISDRVTNLDHEFLIGAPKHSWELGSRDTGSYATMSDVIAYFDWLGGEVSDESDPRKRIEAASSAIHDYEAHLTNAMINGTGNLPGLREMKNVTILAGADNEKRVGLVSISVEGVETQHLVDVLNENGIRTHIRKPDHYSGTVLKPLGLPDCLRISMCHYNSEQEVAKLLSVMKDITSKI